MQNRIPMVDKLLVSLTRAPAYQSNALRIQLEIHALAAMTPSPQEALVYCDRYSQPGGVLTYHVIDALCTNKSPPAIVLLEQKFNNSEHDVYEKQSWMREIILPLRHDVPLVLASERLITQSLPEENKVDFIEALFDYKPDDWYMECAPPLPPDDAAITVTVRDALIRIGEYGMSRLTLADELRQKIQAKIDSLRDSTTL
jgi:hypothetical protein